MESLRVTLLSALRLVLVVAVLLAISGTDANARAQNDGGCNPTTLSGWACAKGSAFSEGKFCDPGLSGGCETCWYTGNLLQTCFMSGQDEHKGWMVKSYGS